MYEKPVEEDIINFWKTPKSSIGIVSFDSEKELAGLDFNYGSNFLNLKSNPLDLKLLTKVKEEVSDLENHFQDRVRIEDVEILIETIKTLKLKVTYEEITSSSSNRQLFLNV